ncbi:hypothetical protein [Maricaulis sp.]|jgi:hypothetical protein|uniref:hypothetical protein n=1 Tax=Maricaulis sp. TaxID=1486257 RepID=UPI0025EC8124|nr:hypothetical protein [Maricaulis sp.]MDF1769146.1 hypothetical protein [Maricaulis sp.]
MLLARLSKISATLFLSMVMAIFMLALLWFYAADWLSWVQDGADLLEDMIAAIPLEDRYNNFVRLFASDDKIVLLIFTIIARIILAIIGGAFTALTGGNDRYKVKEPGLISQVSSMMATLFLSFVVAIIMLAVISIAAEGVLHSLLDAADWVEDQLAHLPIGGRWRAGVRFAVSDDKIVLLFFTIIARLLIAVVATGVSRSVGGGKAEIVPPKAQA